MKKTLFTENQIIAMLKQHGQGIKVQDIARTNGISEKTIYGNRKPLHRHRSLPKQWVVASVPQSV